MIARVLVALALVASVGLLAPWTATPPPLPAVESAATADAAGAGNREDPGRTVQQAVQQAFGVVLPDQSMQFALDSVQSSPVEGGGHRFEGAGIVIPEDGDARFVAFTMTLSARGEMVEFDYSTASPAQDAEQIAGY